jgi:aminopeptidase
VDGLETGDGQTASINWAHIDIAGTMEVCGLMSSPWRYLTGIFQATRKTPYMEKGLTGRPTR